MDFARDWILRVDLSAGRVEREQVPERWLHRYLGGKGLGARYLYSELDANTDPLAPDNLLAFVIGPLTGYLPGESRYAAITKSPLTGTFLDSYSGGAFPDTLAGALDGGLGLLVTGRADHPVQLVVENGSADLEPAETWGDDVVETCEAFPDAAVACVGPAGETQVSYATIATDAGDHHAGRGGAGAVMGSKRLKAVVVRGAPPEVPPALATLLDRHEETYGETDVGRWLSAGGTVETVEFLDEVGGLATRGWQEGQFDGVDDIGVDAARDRASAREGESDGETVPGDFRVDTDDGESVIRGGVPTVLGAGLGIDDFDAVATLGELCDRLGLDVISAGNAVAWAAHASRADVIDRDVAFGDEDGARELVTAIARRDGEVADALAEGVAAAAAHYGTDEMVPTVKSMALPAYDPRVAPGMALAYATSDRGGCHRRARPIEEEALAAGGWELTEQVTAVVTAQNARSVLWSLVVDDFVGETFADLGAEWLTALGYDYDAEELYRTGERIWTLSRLFNVREGFDRTDERLPGVFREPLSDGPAAGQAIDAGEFDAMLDAYYRVRGWGRDGIPTRETLERLDLGDAVDHETPVGEPWVEDSSRQA